jgi:23S rRNA pseudouridine2605 synthase
MKERLAKVIANRGLASRRSAEVLISSGKVKVNGEIVREVVTLVDANDEIVVAGKKVETVKKVYYLLNKPVGYICSKSDPHNSKNVMSLVPRQPAVYPVGRLDKDSQGLLLLTNDGDLTFKLTHPKFHFSKTYLVVVDIDVDAKTVAKLKNGVRLEEGLAKADKVVLKNKRSLEIVLHQGWNRQIRRMLEIFGLKVISLTRISEGKLSLKNLPLGKFKKISISEII